MMNIYNDEYYMKKALELANKAYKSGETPIGCVIVFEKAKVKKMNETISNIKLAKDNILSKAYNKRNKNYEITSHAEIIAINKACKKLMDFRLDGCTMYVTLEPCQMCAGAIVQSRIKRLVIAAKSFKSGSSGTIINILNNDSFNHRVDVEYGLLEKESEKLLKDFFKEIRNVKKNS